MWTDRQWELYPVALRFDLTWRLTELGWKPLGWSNGRPVIPRVGPHVYGTEWPLVDEVAQGLLDEKTASQKNIPPLIKKQPEKAPESPKPKRAPKKTVKKAATRSTARRAAKKKE